MAIGTNQSYTPKSISASALIKTGDGQIGGILIASATAGTVKIWDSLTAAGTVIVDTTTGYTTSATASPVYLDIPAGFSTGLFVTIGGTATITVFYL